MRELVKVFPASSRSTGRHGIGSAAAYFTESRSAVAYCFAMPRALCASVLEKKLATYLQLYLLPPFVSHTDTGTPMVFHDKPAVLQ